MTTPTPFDRLSAAFADRYKLVREIGAGGMATVYLAEDLKHRRQVALKVLRPELAATMGPERFFREIEVAARLQHPHILPLHDSGEADGFLFFVMPFVAGESLRERIDRVGELPVNDAVRMLIEVTDALSYSHAQGVVHRDIKPDNVMISGRHALVTDFGVAKAVSESAAAAKVTTAGVALGTPAYMAPEQASAEPQMDHRVDIYALGVLAYELLTGAPPFSGMPPQKMLMAHVTMAPDPVRKHREACSPELEAIVMKCLAKRPADRWQTADELLEALEPLSASSGGITPTQTRPAAGVTLPPARSRAMAAAGAVAVVVVAVAAWYLGSGRERTSSPIALQRTQLTSTGNAGIPAMSGDGTRIAYGVRVCSDDAPCTIDVHVKDISGAGSAVVSRGLLGLADIEWSSDGRWLVFSGAGQDQWGAFAVPALGGSLRHIGCCNPSMGDGDTVVMADVRLPGKDQTIRWITVSDGVVRDSVVLSDWKAEVQAVWDVPASKRLLAWAGVERPFLYLLDRSGRRLDSIPGSDFGGRPRVRMVSDGFLATVSASAGRGVDIHRYRFDGPDRFDRPSTVLAEGIVAPGGMHIGRNGDVVIGDGSLEFAVWTLERPSTTSMKFVQQLVARSTSEIMGSISASGEELLLLRRRPNEPHIRELSTRAFSGGEEKHLSSHPNLDDWDLAQDGRSVVILRANGSDSAGVIELALPSGRSRPLATVPSETRSIETFPGGGFAHIRGRGIGFVGVQGRPDTVIAGPDSMGEIESLEPSPDGKFLAVYAWDSAYDYLHIYRLSVATLSWEHLATLAGEGGGAITWVPDGSLLIPVQETGVSEAWYRLAPGSRTPVRLGIAPRADASFRLSRNGLRGVAREAVLRPDVYVLRGLAGVLGR